MIYGRWGDAVTVVRLATLKDVRTFDHRSPDAQDREMVRRGSYVILKREDGAEMLANVAFLRADGGAHEIDAAIKATK